MDRPTSIGYQDRRYASNRARAVALASMKTRFIIDPNAIHASRLIQDRNKRRSFPNNK